MILILLVEGKQRAHDRSPSTAVIKLSADFQYNPIKRKDSLSPVATISRVSVQSIHSLYVPSQTQAAEAIIDQEQNRYATTAAYAVLNAQPALWDTHAWGTYEADIYLPDDIRVPVRGSSGGLSYALYQIEKMAQYHEYGGVSKFPLVEKAMQSQIIAATGEIDQAGQIIGVEYVEEKFRGFLHWLKDYLLHTPVDDQAKRIVCLYPRRNATDISDDLKKEFESLEKDVVFSPVDTLTDAIDLTVGEALPISCEDCSPYKGLSKFSMSDSALYYGREETVASTLKSLESYSQLQGVNRHVIIFGDSGTGKSSFLEAGLLSHLTTSLLPVVLRPADSDGSLVEYFVQRLASTLVVKEGASIGRVTDWREAPNQAISDLINSLSTGTAKAKQPQRLNIVIDQAEELIVGGSDHEGTRRFLSLVNQLTHWNMTQSDSHRDVELWVYSTIRTSDYAAYLGLLELRHEANDFFAYQLQKLDPRKDAESFRQIIELPVKARGLRVDSAFTNHVITALTELEDPLPHLQYALDKYYILLKRDHLLKEGFTTRSYKAYIGSIGSILTDTADTIYKSIIEDGKEPRLYRLFDRLLGVDEHHELAYQTPTVRDSFSDERDESLVKSFLDARLLSESNGKIRFTHELLVREWGVTKSWIASKIARSRKQRIRRLRYTAIATSVLMIISLGASLVAIEQRFNANLEKVEAIRNYTSALNEKAETAYAEGRIDDARIYAFNAISMNNDVAAISRVLKRFRATSSAVARMPFALYGASDIKFMNYSHNDEFLVTVSEDNVIRVWDLLSGQSKMVTKVERGISTVAFSRNGHKIAVGRADKEIEVFDLIEGKSTRYDALDFYIASLAFSPDAKTLAVGTGSLNWGGSISFLNLQTADYTVFQEDIRYVQSLEFSPNGNMLASGERGKKVILWEVATGESREYIGHTRPVSKLAFSSDGTQLASGSWDKTVRVWNLSTGDSKVLEGHSGEIAHIAFDYNGEKLVTTCKDHKTLVWDLQTFHSMKLQPGSSSAISTDGQAIALASTGKIRFFSPRGESLQALPIHLGLVTSAAYSPDGSMIAVGGSSGAVVLSEVKTGRVLKELQAHNYTVGSLVFSYDGSLLASAGKRGNTIKVWNIENGSVDSLDVPEDRGTAWGIDGLAFSPTENRLVSYSSGSIFIDIWNLDAKTRKKYSVYSGDVDSLIFTNDGRHLIYAISPIVIPGTKIARLWRMDVSTGKKEELGEHYSYYSSLSLSPDGKNLAIGSRFHGINIYNMQSGKTKDIGSGIKFEHMQYSPDGSMLAAVDKKGTIRVWDTLSMESYTLNGNTDVTKQIDFSPDGKFLLSSDPESVWLWDTAAFFPARLNGNDGMIEGISFSMDGKYLVIASDRKNSKGVSKIKVWSDKQKILHKSYDYNGTVSDMAVSPDGQTIALGSWSTIFLIDLATDKSTRLDGSRGMVGRLAFTPDGTRLVSTASLEEKRIRVWDIQARTSEVLEGHSGRITDIAVSPNGKTLASTAVDWTILLWDLDALNSRILAKSPDVINSLAFSHDGKMLASGGTDYRITLWDLTNGESKKLNETHTDQVVNLVFANTSKSLVSGSKDKTIRIWDLDKGSSRLIMEGYKGRHLAYAPDDSMLAFGCDDQVCIITHENIYPHEYAEKVITDYEKYNGLKLEGLDIVPVEQTYNLFEENAFYAKWADK